MKKYLLALSFFVFSCFLFAQENDSFRDYLSHYKEIKMPYEMCLDSIWTIFPVDNIPTKYVRKFICEPERPCDDSGEYSYDYGVKFKLDDYIVLITSKLCYDCPTEFGLGMTEYLMSVYTLGGHKISHSVLARISYQHFAYVSFTENENPCELLSISTKQGTLNEYLDKRNSKYKGMLDYYDYIIDRDGKIKGDKTKSTNIRVQWGVLKCKILEEWQ